MSNTLRIYDLQYSRRYGAEKSHYLKKMCSMLFLGVSVREFPRTMPEQANLHDFSVML